MNETASARSPELMSRDDTALLVVDFQEKLLPAIDRGRQAAWNARRLIDAARILGLPTLATEQYPKGLGPTIGELAERLSPAAAEKLTFSACGRAELFDGLRQRGIHKFPSAESRPTSASRRRGSICWPTVSCLRGRRRGRLAF